MATVHVAKALFLEKHAVPCAIGLELSNVLSNTCSIHDYCVSINSTMGSYKYNLATSMLVNTYIYLWLFKKMDSMTIAIAMLV